MKQRLNASSAQSSAFLGELLYPLNAAGVSLSRRKTSSPTVIIPMEHFTIYSLQDDEMLQYDEHGK